MQMRIQDHHPCACFPHLQDSSDKLLGDKKLVTDSSIQRLLLTSLPGDLEANSPGHAYFFAHFCIILKPSSFLKVVNPFSSLSLTLIFIVTQITLNTKALVLLRGNRHFGKHFLMTITCHPKSAIARTHQNLECTSNQHESMTFCKTSD